MIIWHVARWGLGDSCRFIVWLVSGCVPGETGVADLPWGPSRCSGTSSESDARHHAKECCVVLVHHVNEGASLRPAYFLTYGIIMSQGSRKCGTELMRLHHLHGAPVLGNFTTYLKMLACVGLVRAWGSRGPGRYRGWPGQYSQSITSLSEASGHLS